ncbi:unnamed protein product [Brassicogethes aeneus]|uniref:Small subunit processome component 20 homolog n=1 Tax=Brassicogethes aeneus TaxID=1431903 RepID=A0A9P0APM3_BRAAE|nr:unnamed protein product [Brassicogethes aeneus]
MKNKSARHKDANTFKFQSFSERISNIDVDVFHKVGHEYETETEENECYFYQAIDKWSVLNLTDGYSKFCREVHVRNYITLPQLLLSKEHVIQTLLKHLKFKDPLFLQPLLDIVVAVAKDLQKDFYQYYPEFLEVLIELLQTKDTEQLEWTFTTLAYLFKILWRSLVKDINSVFVALVPLLSDSQPEYINNFAAESFAFVARKVKDKKAFLKLLLKVVKSKKDGVSGCGKLLYEVVKGVDGQFHSTATTMLPFLLESLSDENLPQSTLFEILEQFIGNVVSNIHPQKSDLLWAGFVNIIESLNDKYTEKKDISVSDNIKLILMLLGRSIEIKNGKVLQKPVDIVKILVKLLENSDFPQEVTKNIIQISILLLLSKNIKLPQDQASSMIRKVLQLKEKSLLLYYVDNVSDYSSFEPIILPSFLKSCVTQNLDRECFHVLTKLILKKAKLCGDGIGYFDWNKYLLDFGNKQSNALMYCIIKDFIKITDLSKINFDDHFCALVCLPHINIGEKTDAIEILEENLKLILPNLTNAENTSTVKKLLFLFLNNLECISHLSTLTFLTENLDKILDILLPLCTDLNYILSLKAVDLLITVLREEQSVITIQTLKKISDVLEVNINSPHHEIRLLTTHIYTFFENIQEFQLRHSDNPEIPAEDFKAFSVCYRIESVDPQVHTYREQVQNLEKLNFDKPQMIMCNKTDFKTIPLRYLCGCTYINFQLLWEPTIKVIQTHAHGLEVNKFWDVYGTELKNVDQNIKTPRENEMEAMETECEFLADLYRDSQKLTSKPDFVNHRLLLWKAMTSFPDVAEAKTRDVSELLLKFIDTEYAKSNSEMALTCSIKENSPVELDETVDDEVEGDDGNIRKKLLKSPPKNNGKANLKALLHMLTVFSKVKSPRSMYREPDLYKLYFDLLQHRNSEVQKVALDCLMTYKFKYLTPYKDNLYNLVDDRNFKNEITAFKIDKDSSLVLPEHRDDLIPIVMQVVFSKMHVKTGGKASGQGRRSSVFRFLAGCREKEMLSFAKKSFRSYSRYLKGNAVDTSRGVLESIDLEKFVPPKKLQSSLNLLNVVLEQFGGLMGDEILAFLLDVLLVVGSLVKGAFDWHSDIHVGYLPALRNVRTTSIKILDRFFEHFDTFPWTSPQINTIFDVFVWPYLEKLNVEGIHSPTSLLKLFCQWGSNPRYFCLLVKHHDDNKDQYILPHVVNLLVNEKSHCSVVNTILEMVEKLLSLQPDDDQLKLPVDNLLPISKEILDRIKVDGNLNYGSCVLLPHVPLILQKIRGKLEGKNKNLSTRELFILSRISELVWEADVSDTILALLLPVVLKKCCVGSSEEVVQQFLSTVKNLIGNVENPGSHLKNISPLFGEVNYPSCRKILTQILELTGRNDAFGLIDDLNAWDRKWIEQPDFEKRHDAFQNIQRHCEGDFDVNFGVLLIYNCFYLVKSEKDLSLRENSSHLLKTLCPVFIRKYQNSRKEIEYILNDTLFSVIRRGFKSKHDDVRNLSISLLGHLARECPDSHFILRDLNKYTNKVDLEVDFFENLTHLQLHRHARALLKFCQISKDQIQSPNPRTLTQFILPLATHYLCCEKYASKNSVVDAAIETVGVVCRILPWHQYEGLLKYYLTRLRSKIEHQKQLVRLTVAILDAFHFDLSKGHVLAKVEDVVEDVENLDPPVKGSEEEKEDDDDLDVDEALDKEIDEENDEEEPQMEEVKAFDKTTCLCKSTATRVIKTIQIVLLPQLHKSLAILTQHDTSHKVNRKRTGFEREEEDLLKVPISLAVVKLLQRLPKAILDVNLPGVFMKLCTFLKSQLESVRRVARETLQKIMLALGPKYLGILLSEMSPLLTRGFHSHVLVFTSHGVLSCLKDLYEPGDIDVVLLTVIDLCNADLFGKLSEEKEVSKIASKTSEVKSTKSFDTYQIVAQYITEKCLMDLLLPIKRILESTHSFKTVHKAQETLRYISQGLLDNSFVSLQSLLKFAYGTSSQSIPQLLTKEKPKLSQKELEIKSRQKEDCLILPKMPMGKTAFREGKVKSSASTNAHLLIEFGLRLCFMMLKREKIKDEQYRPFVDPFVAIFKKCLKSKHIKLSTLTLQCLSWIMKYELPSMEQSIKNITKDIFGILHKYASAGLSKGDNFDLVMAAFKAIAVLVRDVKYHTIDAHQLKALLLYAEQDVHDHDRQATAFNLLKAIIARKLIVPEINEVMAKVAELSVTSELSHVRAQARAVFHQFLMDYPVGKALEAHLGFYISQMGFEMQYGRESAIEMVHSLVNSFPDNVLKEHSGTLLVTLGARLVNDEVPECRKMIANCITAMLQKLPKADRQPLFEIVTLWLKDKNISHRRLAAQLCGLFVTVEKQEFESRLPLIMPLIMKQFGIDNSAGKFVKLNKVKESEDTEERQRSKDHHLYQVFQLLLKISAYCPLFLKRQNDMEDLAIHTQSLLGYPHDWVRLGAAQFLGFVLSGTDVVLLADLMVKNESAEVGYLRKHPVNSVKSLALDLCDQLVPGSIKSDLAEQVIKNLVFVARVLEKVPLKDEGDKKINLLWLTKRMRKIVNAEVVEDASSIVLRTEVFKWIAGVATALELDRLKPILHHLMAPLVREMITVEEKNSPLRQLSKEVANLIKKRIGMEQYTKTLTQLQQSLSVKRAERKRVRTQLAVTDPEIFAKKKIKRHEKKKELKKRKIADFKGKPRNFKKRKTVDLQDNSECF